MLLANGFSTFPIKDNPVFSNGLKSLPKNPPDCPILCHWVFDNFILADERFEKALISLETCVLVNNSLCWKLFSSVESLIIFDERFEVTAHMHYYTSFLSIINLHIIYFSYAISK